MAAPRIPCRQVLWMVKHGFMKSGDVRKLVNHRAISRDCGRDVIREIRGKIAMNGRRRRR